MKYLCRDINDQLHLVDEKDLEEHISVYAIIHDERGILLVSQLDNENNFYDFPGGGIEGDESIEAGLTRELQEETGLDLDKISNKVCEFVEFFFDLRSRTGRKVTRKFFNVEVGGKLNPHGNDDDVGEAKYFENPLGDSNVKPIVKLVLNL